MSRRSTLNYTVKTYCLKDINHLDIIRRLAKCESPPFRPSVKLGNDMNIEPAVLQLMNDCWKEDPEMRPSFKQIKSIMKQMARGR